MTSELGSSTADHEGALVAFEIVDRARIAVERIGIAGLYPVLDGQGEFAVIGLEFKAVLAVTDAGGQVTLGFRLRFIRLGQAQFARLFPVAHAPID